MQSCIHALMQPFIYTLLEQSKCKYWMKEGKGCLDAWMYGCMNACKDYYLINFTFIFTISERLPVLTGGPQVPAPDET